MTTASGEQAPSRQAAPAARARDRRSLWQPARDRFPARPDAEDWPAAALPRSEAQSRLTGILAGCGQDYARIGPGLLLDWLEEQPGATWQERWLASGADQAGRDWRDLPRRWLLERGCSSPDHRAKGVSVALRSAVAADMIRPSMRWLLVGGASDNRFTRELAAERDPEGFARLREILDADPELPAPGRRAAAHRAAVIVAAKGGLLGQVTIGDLLAEYAAEEDILRRPCEGMQIIYGALRAMGVLQGPATFRQLRAAGPQTPEQLIDRYRLSCRPVRDLLVDYLRERQPALDYSTLRQISYELGKLFWADLERHNPGISGIRLPEVTAAEWKQRLQVKDGSGGAAQVGTERISARSCLTTVRAFYLDIAQWALDDPARWAQWAVPCPVRPSETSSRKASQHRKSRMDARTRERLPALPALAGAVARQRSEAAALLAAAREAGAGEEFTAAGRTMVRHVVRGGSPLKVWARDPAGGRPVDLAGQESYAFWAWAAVEVLRHTGIRIEELRELSHHSLVRYRLPGTGEVVPLLQITPSKTDAERLLLVSPELSDVLATVISRVRAPSGTVPLVAAYDIHERQWLPPAPLLFQRRFRGYDQALHDSTIRKMLNAAITRAGIAGTADGKPLRYTPHDFRRMFITDAVLNGLPPHIAQVIAGHRDINVTMGYKAVYPDEAIQAHLAHLARRRALRPSEEYRAPTDEEWEQFLGHFERRKVAAGTCGRAFSTPCAHEHACIRCPMLWPDPAQKQRLTGIRDNLAARISEAEREGWLGEIEGLKISLAGADDKLAQINRRSGTSAFLGVPSIRK